jgi:hypothetical protein
MAYRRHKVAAPLATRPASSSATTGHERDAHSTNLLAKRVNPNQNRDLPGRTPKPGVAKGRGRRLSPSASQHALAKSWG